MLAMFAPKGKKKTEKKDSNEQTDNNEQIIIEPSLTGDGFYFRKYLLMNDTASFKLLIKDNLLKYFSYLFLPLLKKVIVLY